MTWSQGQSDIASGEAEGAASPGSLEDRAAAFAIEQEGRDPGLGYCGGLAGRSEAPGGPPAGEVGRAAARAPELSDLGRTVPGCPARTAGRGLLSQDSGR
ncbi:unnamed protein product [Rangifer tarandus platyrhynchus]|uniref:Uncharacterized protein n=2 Tax=Rangifer tarandus platyrhynchus TaxID=3082113 RepID=A0ACB0DZE7_RANTA|nr:unnamed protein product [Rangifer tarandus platyrhynchus]CAI9693698.1 unnamed protein product [Rangifer tarandus platyrhynchus]